MAQNPCDNQDNANMTKGCVAELMRQFLVDIGEDPEREGLIKTPGRVESAWSYLTSGYTADLDTVVNEALFTETCDEMVIVKHIHFFSVCEHHLLPFYGTCSIGYIPRGKVIGLSKIPRIVDVFSRRLQLQERMTRQIAEALDDILHPLGVAVVSEAAHLCMMMRGVEKQDSVTTSSAMLGAFRNDRGTRSEFLSLIGINQM